MIFDISTPSTIRKSGKVIAKAFERELNNVIAHQEIKNENAKSVLADELRTRQLKQIQASQKRAAKLNDLVAEVTADSTDVSASHKEADALIKKYAPKAK